MRTTCALVFVALAACKKEGATDAGGPPVATPSTAPQCVDDANKHMNGGKLSSCLLAAEWTVGKLTCSKGKVVSVYPDGSLKGCWLAKSADVGGFMCMDGTDLYEDGKFRRCKLTAARTVNGVDLRAGDWVTAYKSGALKRVELSGGPAKLKGLPCKGFFNYLHENGQLKKCELSEATKIEGKDIAAGTLVCFDDKGKSVADCKMLSWDMLD